MNAMIYMRGHRSIFDAWAEEDGANGWSYAEVLPYFKRSEHHKRPHGEDHVVQIGAHARRIVLEGGRATGIEYQVNGTPVTARAAREVIVSAGAFNSPQLLMLSGIGPADHLREHGIEVALDSPAVGAHLQEHPMAFINWRTRELPTLDDATHPKYAGQWVATRRGKLSSTIA